MSVRRRDDGTNVWKEGTNIDRIHNNRMNHGGGQMPRCQTVKLFKGAKCASG